MNEAAETSWLQTTFSLKTYRSSGCFNIKFPGLALAWLAITASTVVRIIFLTPLIHDAADITLYLLSFAIGLYGAAKNKLVILGLLPILWSCLLSHWALIIIILTNTDKAEHFSIALGVTIAGALALYYYVAAISYKLLSIELNSEATEPITAATVTVTAIETITTAAPATAITTTTTAKPALRRSRPSVPHLPSIIERSFTAAPSGDASSVPQEQQKPSDHRFVGGPMPIISY